MPQVSQGTLEKIGAAALNAAGTSTAEVDNNEKSWWMDFDTRPGAVLVRGGQISAMSLTDLRSEFEGVIANGKAIDDCYWRDGYIYVGASSGSIAREDLAAVVHPFMGRVHPGLVYTPASVAT